MPKNTYTLVNHVGVGMKVEYEGDLIAEFNQALKEGRLIAVDPLDPHTTYINPFGIGVLMKDKETTGIVLPKQQNLGLFQ